MDKMFHDQRARGLNPAGLFMQIDFKKAFSSLNKKRVMKMIIHKYNYIFFHKLLGLNEITGTVNLNFDKIVISITRGLGEGLRLSPYLFNIAAGLA